MLHDVQKILTLANADDESVSDAVRLLRDEMGFAVTAAPRFGAEGGGARLEKDGLEVHLSWSREGVLVVTTRNRAFEQTRDAMVALIRPLNRKRVD